MPWNESKAIDLRRLFLVDFQTGHESFARVCKRYGISRKTGYKWFARFKEEGLPGLQDRSHTPFRHGRRTDVSREDMIVLVRLDRPTWGPKKILAWLDRQYPGETWPSTTTIGNIIARHGLVCSRAVKQKLVQLQPSLAPCYFANDTWCMDFKGWFKTGDGRKCQPFTVSDHESRFLLSCSPLPFADSIHCWSMLNRLFKKHGLPKRIRSDNGSPFASKGKGKLTPLVVNLIKAGVIPERITPGKPQQNGRHERIHKTLHQEVASPPANSYREQLERIQQFQYDYNYERPHEALGQKLPGEFYTQSSREWNGHLKSPEYGSDVVVRWVREQGSFKWRNRSMYIGRALSHEPVGLVPTKDEGYWHVIYGPLTLGILTPEGKIADFVKGAPHRADLAG